MDSVAWAMLGQACLAILGLVAFIWNDRTKVQDRQGGRLGQQGESIISLTEKLNTARSEIDALKIGFNEVRTQAQNLSNEIVRGLADIRSRLDSMDKDIRRLGEDRSRERLSVEGDAILALKKIARALGSAELEPG